MEQTADAKALELATQKLKESREWVQAQEKRNRIWQQRIDRFKLTLFWIGRWVSSGLSGMIFYFVCLLIYVAIGFIAGLNYPDKISCSNNQSICEQLRWDKSKVVIPKQEGKGVQKYLRLRNKQRSHR